MAKKSVDNIDDLDSAEALLRKVAKQKGVDAALLQRLIEIEQGKVHLERRRGIVDTLRKTIEEHGEGGLR